MTRKESNLKFNGVPSIPSQSEPSTATLNGYFFSHFFAIFCASQSKILGAPSSTTQSASSSSPFIELFCELFCANKCTTMCIFKCNSIVISSAPLVSTSNVGVPSDEPSGAPSTALACSYLNQAKRQVHLLCQFIVHLQLLSMRTLSPSFKSNIKPTIRWTF